MSKNKVENSKYEAVKKIIEDIEALEKIFKYQTNPSTQNNKSKDNIIAALDRYRNEGLINDREHVQFNEYLSIAMTKPPKSLSGFASTKDKEEYNQKINKREKIKKNVNDILTQALESQEKQVESQNQAIRQRIASENAQIDRPNMGNSDPVMESRKETESLSGILQNVLKDDRFSDLSKAKPSGMHDDPEVRKEHQKQKAQEREERIQGLVGDLTKSAQDTSVAKQTSSVSESILTPEEIASTKESITEALENAKESTRLEDSPFPFSRREDQNAKFNDVMGQIDEKETLQPKINEKLVTGVNLVLANLKTQFYTLLNSKDQNSLAVKLDKLVAGTGEKNEAAKKLKADFNHAAEKFFGKNGEEAKQYKDPGKLKTAYQEFKSALETAEKDAEKSFGKHRGWHGTKSPTKRIMGLVAAIPYFIANLIGKAAKVIGLGFDTKWKEHFWYKQPQAESQAKLGMFKQQKEGLFKESDKKIQEHEDEAAKAGAAKSGAPKKS